MADLKAIQANVEKCQDLEQSATTLVNGLADALDGLTQDPVAIKALAADLRKDATALGAAICANTSAQSAGPSGARAATAQTTPSPTPPKPSAGPTPPPKTK